MQQCAGLVIKDSAVTYAKARIIIGNIFDFYQKRGFSVVGDHEWRPSKGASTQFRVFSHSIPASINDVVNAEGNVSGIRTNRVVSLPLYTALNLTYKGTEQGKPEYETGWDFRHAPYIPQEEVFLLFFNDGQRGQLFDERELFLKQLVKKGNLATVR